MAGSLNHICKDEDGTFTMNTVENMGDAHEALAECHQWIAHLLGYIRYEKGPDVLADIVEEIAEVIPAPIPKHLPVFDPKANDYMGGAGTVPPWWSR